MLVFRCTQRVVRQFKLLLVDQPSPSTGTLGDWYVNFVMVGSQRWLLCVSERCLLPVLLPAAPDSLRTHFQRVLCGVLRMLEIKEDLIAQELLCAVEIALARTRNRQVLGVMNDFARNVEDYPRRIDGMEGAIKASLWLAETPSRPIGYQSPDRLVHSVIVKHRA